jgi:hypothetical protein
VHKRIKIFLFLLCLSPYVTACSKNSSSSSESNSESSNPNSIQPLSTIRLSINEYSSPSPSDHFYTGVYVEIPNHNQIIDFKTKLTVPLPPSNAGTLFLWPGLDPIAGGSHFLPINNGVLQPVLTWGLACAPGNQPEAYSTWWISGQYVNTNGSAEGFTGCQGGSIMPVAIGDTLNIEFSLNANIWTQTITDVQTGTSVDFAIDLLGQAQNIAYFQIEGYGQHPVQDTIFTDSVLTFESPLQNCRLGRNTNSASETPTGFFSPPVLSNGNRTCSIASMQIHAP